MSHGNDNIDLTLQGNLQFGEKPRGADLDSTIQDISAFMVNGELGYNFKGEGKARISGGVDYSSGDDGSDSTKYSAYTNSYYTGHKFRGFMDKFLGDGIVNSINSGLNTETYYPGLIDIYFRAKINPSSKWLLKGDFHYFKTAENYTSLADDTTLTTNVGMEFDFTVVTKAISGAAISGGASFFLADDHFSESGANKSTGLWIYTMATVSF